MPDAYTLRARIAPAVLLSIPAFALLGGLGVSPASLGLVTGGVIAAVALVTAGQVAERGRALEVELFTRWGGAPTSRALSLLESDDPGRVQARRTAVEHVGQMRLPSADDERADPTRSRAELDAAVARVRACLREDETNRILADVNAEYGFRRNCLSIRPLGIRLAAAAGAAGGALYAFSVGGRPVAYLVACAVSAALVGFWWRYVTDAWVHAGAARYSTQFYETLMKAAATA